MRTEWTVTPAGQKQISRGFWLATLLSPQGAVVVVYLFVLLLWGLLVHSGLLMAVTAVVVAVIVGAIWGVRIRRTVKTTYPVGFTASFDMGEAGIRLSNAIAVSEVPWQNLVKPRKRGAAVVLLLPNKQRIAIPRALLPDEALVRLGLPSAHRGSAVAR